MAKTALQECIERLKEGDFVNWFYQNTERLLNLEKEQIQNAHVAGQNSADDVDGENEIEYYIDVYGSRFQ